MSSGTIIQYASLGITILATISAVCSAYSANRSFGINKRQVEAIEKQATSIMKHMAYNLLKSYTDEKLFEENLCTFQLRYIETFQVKITNKDTQNYFDKLIQQCYMHAIHFNDKSGDTHQTREDLAGYIQDKIDELHLELYPGIKLNNVHTISKIQKLTPSFS